MIAITRIRQVLREIDNEIREQGLCRKCGLPQSDEEQELKCSCNAVNGGEYVKNVIRY